jgi:hypothetical protein
MATTTFFLRLAPFLIFAAMLRAQTAAPANPCAAPQQKQFDFWVGDWDLTWPRQNAGETGHGTNSIKRILDDCIVQENFTSLDASHMRGTSVSVFEPKSGHWKQTWVDNQGSYLDFTGDFKDGRMILQREFTRPDGVPMMQRMVWKNIGANEFDWSWEASTDGGKTWQVNWPIHYKRKS